MPRANGSRWSNIPDLARKTRTPTQSMARALSNHGSRRKAEDDYRAIRREAGATLEPELRLSLNLDVRLTDITPDALQRALSWGDCYTSLGREHHRPGWDWEKALRKFRRRPRRVELAIWIEDELCGLALGRISDRCVVATIHFIEANPLNHPLTGKLVPVATRYLEVLATSLGAQEISIEQPVPDLIEYYKSIGFRHTTSKGEKVLRLKKMIAG